MNETLTQIKALIGQWRNLERGSTSVLNKIEDPVDTAIEQGGA